jgi:5-methyltetrahydropteroyltriglutamate--homocysteine methyltransferase
MSATSARDSRAETVGSLLRPDYLKEAVAEYDPIAEQLYNTLNVQRLFLEYDTPRAGNFALLRFLPADKTVVLGLITTKTPEIETPATLQARVAEASHYVALERLALSPQCGFASTLAGNLITPEVQRATLETLGRVARDIWR